MLAEAGADTRPRTLLVHHRSGIGDLIWHVPYIRAAAAQSAGGKVSVLARSSCRAAEVLAAETCVDSIHDYDRRPRGGGRGRNEGLLAQWRLAGQLRTQGYQRILIFSSRPRYGAIAWLAGIPQRCGFGFTWGERLLLNHPPYIQPYRGPGNWVYPEASAFAIAQGLVSEAQVPRMSVLDGELQRAAQDLSSFPASRCAFAIGASSPARRWPSERYAELASQLVERGHGVLLLGGPAETTLAAEIFGLLPQAQRPAVLGITEGSIQRSAAMLRHCRLCLGNDTGALNMAPANGVPGLGLFGVSPPLLHDPLLQAISGAGMQGIAVAEVLERALPLLEGPDA